MRQRSASAGVLPVILCLIIMIILQKRKFCMKFVYLIFRKIIQFVDNICQILRLKRTEIDFGWGSRWRSLRTHRAQPDPLAGVKGLSSKGCLLYTSDAADE